MVLGVFERLILLSILPREGDFMTLKIMRRLREELSFDEKEHAALRFKQEGERVHWKKEAEKDKDIEIGEKATDIIVEVLKRLNKQKKLQDEHFSLYEKFVENN